MSSLVTSANMADERVGEAYELEEQLTVVGDKLDPGQIAPDIILDHFEGEAIRSVTLADSDGSVRVLNVVTRSTRRSATSRPGGGSSFARSCRRASWS